MKKLLLTLALVLGLSSVVSAETYTITPDMTTFTEGTYQLDGKDKGNLSGSWKSGNVEFPVVIYQNTSTTAVTGIKGQNNQLRWYKSMIMTIDAPAGSVITKLELVFGSSNKGKTFESQCGGTVTAATATTKGLSAVWEDTDGVTQFKGLSSDGQIRADQVIITCVASGDTRSEAGLSFPASSYTVALGETFTAPVLTKATTADVTYTSSNEAVATVDKTTGDVTLVGVGTTVITANAEANTEYRAGTASYTLTVTKVYDSVAEFYTIGANNKGGIGFDLIVTYVNGANCYAQTEDGEATLIYGSTSYEVGDIIPAGWEGQYAPFNGLDEIKPVGTMPAASGTTTFVPAEVTSVSKADMNRVVVLKNVKFDAATATGSTKTNFDGTVDEVTYTFRNNFADVPSVEAGLYNVKLAVSYYVDKNNNETLQLYPIAYTAITETGIDDVVVDENAPVEYYNLQGVRVANPENGLYIRRQGNKATKVLVK